MLHGPKVLSFLMSLPRYRPPSLTLILAYIDLQLFTETLFKHERPPALQVPRVPSLFADGSAALPWGTP